MSDKMRGIVLGTVKHSDRASIVSVYTQSAGRVSLLVNVGAGKGARRTAAMLMPLAQIEFECSKTSGRELMRPRGLNFAATYRDIYFSPVKNALCFFLAEFLGKLLRQADPDPLVYRYISESLTALDLLPASSVANFHIVFLSGLATFMGITPDIDGYREGALFDMRAGSYATLLPPHKDVLLGDAARLPLTLSRLNYANMHRLHLSRADRASMLDGLLHYWAIHYPGVASLQSPEILSALFV